MKTTKFKKLVIVESPVKAKTISRFLGSDYIIESCMGHIRDLPSSAKELPKEMKKKSWSHFGVDVDDDFKPFYCISASKKAIVKKLKSQISSVGELILATDADREGESIAWHLQEVLKPKIPVKRMVFHEITKTAIQESLNNFRDLDNHLVQAQEARRVLDRLVGYSISPLLWKKITWGLSAGRVQSVAVSLVSQREMERLAFIKSTYGGLLAEHKTDSQDVFKSRLVFHKGKRLARSADFDSITGEFKKSNVLIMKEAEVVQLKKSFTGKKFKVTEVEKKQVKRKPPAPFITSTLQQECSRKLGFSSKQTMGVAQKLYEQGLITYMRTDSTFLSAQALKAARTTIVKEYGKDSLPAEPRMYRKKSKGAQEAHEAIRPAGNQFVKPQQSNLHGPLLNLYDLIWKRTLASQMKDCIQNQVRVQMEIEQSVFQSSGMSIYFAGFYLVYQDQKTDETQLPILTKGQEINCTNMETIQHETKAPPQYTEASLIQKLEKEGVGRPSTYSSIISTIQDRGYVIKNKNTLVPTFTSLIVARFLNTIFPDYVDMKFTSEMEKNLDDIALGKKDYVKYLKSVYLGKSGLKQLVIDQEKKIKDKNFKSLSLKGLEEYSFNVGQYGAYISKKVGEENISASLPHDINPVNLSKEIIEMIFTKKLKGGRVLGKDPKTGAKIMVIVGKYGPYVTLKVEDKKDDPPINKKTAKKTAQTTSSKSKKKNFAKTKAVSLKPFFKEDDITMEQALQLLELPKVLGVHPETNKEIKKALGRFGPYIMHNGEFRSVPADDADSFFNMDLKYAIQRMSEPKRLSSRVLKELGEHPDSKKPVHLMKGRYGFYLKYNNVNYAVPAEHSIDDVNMSIAVQLIANYKPKDKFVSKKAKTTTKKKSVKKGK